MKRPEAQRAPGRTTIGLALFALAMTTGACSRAPAGDEATPRSAPSTSAAAALPAVAPPARRTAPRADGPAWRSLRWGMRLDAVLAELARDGIRVTGRGGLGKTDTVHLSVAGEGFTGTLYVEPDAGLGQVLLFGAETRADTAARAALERITRARGAPDPARRRDQHRWWNARMALELLILTSERDAGWQVSEHYVVDPRPERAGASPAFDATNGWGPFTWGARPEEIEAWLRGQGLAFDRDAAAGDPGPNAPIVADPSLPSLKFQRGAERVIASFTAKRGMSQVLTNARYATAAEAEEALADRVRRYGPATNVELQARHVWRGPPTKTELSVVHRGTQGTWQYVEEHLPAEP